MSTCPRISLSITGQKKSSSNRDLEREKEKRELRLRAASQQGRNVIIDQERGLDTSGTKLVLVARLQEALGAENPKDEEKVEAATEGDVDMEAKEEAATEDTEAESEADVEASTPVARTNEMKEEGKEAKAIEDLKEKLEGAYIRAGVVGDNARVRSLQEMPKNTAQEDATNKGIEGGGPDELRKEPWRTPTRRSTSPTSCPRLVWKVWTRPMEPVL